MANGTWSLSPKPPNNNIIRSKWVYKIKQKLDGSIDHFKTWLVANGFKQVSGLDYTKTFNPVIKVSTIQFGWKIHQLDA